MKNFILLVLSFLTINLVYSQCDNIEDIEVYIPNAITADGDNVNDAWRIETSCEFDECEIMIFNNWGQLIWRTDDIEKYWNGEVHNGNHYSQTTIYKYIVTLSKNNIPSGNIKKYGTIAVIR
jgi:gliding motility-associated-like protein